MEAFLRAFLASIVAVLVVLSAVPSRAADVPERGGLKGWIGIAEEVSDISLACRQIGPIAFKAKFEQGEDIFRQRRSLFFKKMQIVRGCDAKRNVLVYMVYSDKLIDGSPKNSTSSVPIMPWGGGDAAVQKCGEFIQ
jgi:CreA protein